MEIQQRDVTLVAVVSPPMNYNRVLFSLSMTFNCRIGRAGKGGLAYEKRLGVGMTVLSVKVRDGGGDACY